MLCTSGLIYIPILVISTKPSVKTPFPLSARERSARRYGLCTPLSPSPLSTTSTYMPSGAPPLSLILCFRRSTEVYPTSRTAHFSAINLFLPFFHHAFVRRFQTSRWKQMFNFFICFAVNSNGVGVETPAARQQARRKVSVHCVLPSYWRRPNAQMV